MDNLGKKNGAATSVAAPNFSPDYGVTVNVAGWLWKFPELATIVTVPGATPFANPLLSMVAVPEKLQNQVKVAFVTGLPCPSSAVAVN